MTELQVIDMFGLLSASKTALGIGLPAGVKIRLVIVDAQGHWVAHEPAEFSMPAGLVHLRAIKAHLERHARFGCGISLSTYVAESNSDDEL